MTMTLANRETLLERVRDESEVPQCSDLDDDCDTIPDKVHCYLYDPAKGFCPFLREKGPQHDTE